METNQKNNGRKNNNANQRNGVSKTAEHSLLQLKELFPEVDAPFIEKIFKMNESDLEVTISQV